MGATLAALVTSGLIVLACTFVGTVAMAVALDRRRPRNRYQGRHRRAF
ncbi:hypothetical protein [Actinomadura sp. WMMB 499]|nr:hypothetical protein [Actinomadura sp. WMMB 499]